MAAPAPAWTPPASFEEYRLVRLLGQGTMGQVYVAHDTLLDRPVAVKFLSGVAPNAGQRERFRMEARAIARLQHPNVVVIHRVGEVAGRPYLVSELVRGQTLDQLPLPLPWPRALGIGIDLARGLAAAHRRGVLHRDIKPANAILAETGEVRLLDFGLAKLRDAARDSPDEALPGVPIGAPPPTTLPEEADATMSVSGHEEPPTAALALPAPPSSPSGDIPAQLTATGALVGTPRYMAPESWRGEPATPQSDVYSLGVVLYELCAGRAPYPSTSIEQLRAAVLAGDAARLTTVAPGIDPHLGAIIDRCIAPSPSERYASGEALRDALEALRDGSAAAELPPATRPYPGLHPFSADDRSAFFGRSSESSAVLERLRTEPLVLVAGDSGVGKSSLCRAGIVPRVTAGAIGPGWTVISLLPGRHPVDALAAALAPLLDTGEDALRDTLRHEPHTLGRMLRMHREPRVEGQMASGTLLFVDQLEELVTLAGAEEAALLAEALASLATRIPGVRLLGTVRGDFITRLAALPGLGELVSGALYLLQPLSPAHLRAAITGPAEARGVHFESDTLVDTLVAAGAEGLPLLQFALAELWEARDTAQQVITTAALAAIGGVSGALARHADSVLGRLVPAEREAARTLLLRLITAQGTRARRTAAELIPSHDPRETQAARAALDALVQGRLLAVRDTDRQEATYTLAHEALIHGWDTLRSWLASDEELRIARERVERAAREWDRLGRPSEGQWTGRQLQEIARLDLTTLPPVDRAFIAASRQATRRRRWLRAAAIAALPVTVLTIYGGVRWRAAAERNRTVAAHLTVADQSLAAARAHLPVAAAARKRAFAAFDRGQDTDGQAQWDLALGAEREIERRLRVAGDRLEAALLVQSDRQDVRRRLAEVVYQRVLQAERTHRKEEQEPLGRRLEAFDNHGDLIAQLHAPAHLQIRTRPAGAAVQIERYRDDHGRLSPDPARSLGHTPLTDLALEPGSWRLTLTAPGRPPVRYPVLLAPGEPLSLDLDLPARVPEGFVYVPPGRFLYGSPDDERIRRNFLRIPPMHELRTGAYFIARHEVTYAEWITYLRALPEAERDARRPHVDNSLNGDVTLTETGGRWRLWLRTPTLSSAQAYVASEGQRIHYRERDRRADQDWLQLPVSGVSITDGRAYAAWLARSGRVPGARVCSVLEWERAARGADGRAYPHGAELAPDDANIDITYGQRNFAFGPDEVGAHPRSDSPFGVADLVGNVLEWMEDLPSRETLYGGGCFYHDLISARSDVHSAKLRNQPTHRGLFIGLRLCADAP